MTTGWPAQKFIEKKTNEIQAAQELLRLMDLRDTIVTADAMDCQKETVAAIVSGKGDYALALKGNQQRPLIIVKTSKIKSSKVAVKVV